MSDASAPSYLTGPEECEAFLSEFEAGSVPSAEWTHQAHIAMATVYLARYGDSVLPHTRAALRNHLLSRGRPIGFYHETLTIFWLALVAEAMRAQETLPLHTVVRCNCATFGSQSKLHERYYSFDVLNSAEAHARWMPPDLLSLTIPFPTDV
ncbi:MAG TPA: hypothetical protein VN734_09975 [Acidobacteriaceae bacterium]|nr:hypothetical protein [Acidobacteriaceae bacterium]